MQKTMKTTIDNITDEQIEALRVNAGAHGDYATVACATVALGDDPAEYPPVVDRASDPAIKRWLDHPGDKRDARLACAEIIADAEAMARR